MKSFRDVSIERKVALAILLTGTAVLLVSSLVFFTNDLLLFWRAEVTDNSALANILGTNCSAALAFDDAKAAEETLRALKFKPHVTASSVYDKNGRWFAQYLRVGEKRDVPARPGPPGARFERLRLVVVSPVTLDDKRIGAVYLESDLLEIVARFERYLALIILLALLSFLLIRALSFKFQQLISKPILELAGMAKVISEKHDYSLRVRQHGQDELGYLTDSFNQMLTLIQQRDNALKKINQQLESRVEERTAELNRLNEELKRRAMELQASNKELEAFSYSVSHDLRAPLRHVDGFVTLLEENQNVQKLDEEGRHFLKNISESTKEMGKLIDDLLAFSRMGRAEMRKGRVSMGSLVEEVVKGMQRDTQGRHVAWEIGPLPEVYGDAAMLRQVWVNLLSNALKFTRHREASRTEIGSSTDKDEFVFFVRDNGAGFEMAYANKLFGVFQRLHRSSEFEGTGIGLANVQRIIHRHGGRVWAEGVVDGGATFYFSLPKIEGGANNG